MAKGGYQRKRLEQRKLAEKAARRRARRRKVIATWGVTVGVFALIIVLLLLLIGGDDEGSLAGDVSPTPTPSPTAVLPEGCTEAEGAPPGEKPSYEEPPEMQIDPSKSYTATIVTNCGEMTLNLFAAEAPNTVNNFLFLAREDFFDGLVFHRVIDDFMIQGGDPLSTGAGGPGYQFEDENIDRQFDKPGLLAMANSGPGTNGSQFFLTDVEISHLNPAGPCPGGRDFCHHSIFGELTEGLDVYQRIIGVQTDMQDRPLADMVIIDVTITES